MHFGKKLIAIITIIVILSTASAHARSLYAITKCAADPNAILTAYDIQAEQVEDQIDTPLDRGAIGLALDPDSETLFATYDSGFGSGYQIVLINAKTLRTHPLKL
jgi:hypothetical protein